MNLLVTGHQGRIGSHLVPALTAAGHEVRGADIKTGGDILRPHFGADVTREYRPDAIIHLAAQSSVQESVSHPYPDALANVMGTLVVLDMARELKCRVVLAGSAGTVYDIQSPYGLSKKTAMEYGALYSILYELDVVTLGMGNVYGPEMGGVVDEFTRDHNEPYGVMIYGDGMQTRDYVHITDVTRAFVESLDWAAGYYEVATGILSSVLALFRLMTYEWGFTPAKREAPALYGEVVNSPELRCDLPWTPLKLEEGLSSV